MSASHQTPDILQITGLTILTIMLHFIVSSWAVYKEGLPDCMKVEPSGSLPREEQFSRKKEYNIIWTGIWWSNILVCILYVYLFYVDDFIWCLFSNFGQFFSFKSSYKKVDLALFGYLCFFSYMVVFNIIVFTIESKAQYL